MTRIVWTCFTIRSKFILVQTHAHWNCNGNNDQSNLVYCNLEHISPIHSVPWSFHDLPLIFNLYYLYILFTFRVRFFLTPATELLLRHNLWFLFILIPQTALSILLIILILLFLIVFRFFLIVSLIRNFHILPRIIVY